jgi:hypothetical protein
MSFREKSAWISFVCLLLFGALYAWHAVSGATFRALGIGPMVFVFGTLVALVALEIALHIAIAIQSPNEARTPRDEREQLIDLRASRVAFYTLLTGTFASIAAGMHLPGGNRLLMSNWMMGSIIVTGLVRFGTQIVLSRRDA